MKKLRQKIMYSLIKHFDKKDLAEIEYHYKYCDHEWEYFERPFDELIEWCDPESRELVEKGEMYSSNHVFTLEDRVTGIFKYKYCSKCGDLQHEREIGAIVDAEGNKI